VSDTKLTLAGLGGRINKCLATADQFAEKALSERIAAGRLLLIAQQRVQLGETNLGWEHWCKENVKRSLGDIRKLLALGRADDPEAAQEAERARNRAHKGPSVREHVAYMNGFEAGRTAATENAPNDPRRAHDEGVGAYLRGVAEDDCPYTETKAHAAWRKGFAEQRDRAECAVSQAAPVERPDPIQNLDENAEKTLHRWATAAYPDEIENWITAYFSWKPKMRHQAREAFFSRVMRNLSPPAAEEY
jgi:ribosome modulation factor